VFEHSIDPPEQASASSSHRSLAVIVGAVADVEIVAGGVRTHQRTSGAAVGALFAQVTVGAVAGGPVKRIPGAVDGGRIAVVVLIVADLQGAFVYIGIVVVAVGTRTGRAGPVAVGVLVLAIGHARRAVPGEARLAGALEHVDVRLHTAVGHRVGNFAGIRITGIVHASSGVNRPENVSGLAGVAVVAGVVSVASASHHPAGVVTGSVPVAAGGQTFFVRDAGTGLIVVTGQAATADRRALVVGAHAILGRAGRVICAGIGRQAFPVSVVLVARGAGIANGAIVAFKAFTGDDAAGINTGAVPAAGIGLTGYPGLLIAASAQNQDHQDQKSQ
jgi:hypothetical protein